MRYARWVGGVWLAASVVACAGVRREGPVGVSAGAGGAVQIDTGRWASVSQTPEMEQERRRLYEQVAEDLGLERPAALRGSEAQTGDAVGGGGRAGEARRSCAELLAADEPAVVVSGELDFATSQLLTVNVPGQGPMKLRADASTCAVQAGQGRLPESLLEGTEVSVSYVMENGIPTARVVRAAPVRFTR